MMTEQELREKLRGLTQPMPQETHRAFLRAAYGKEASIMKRKLSFSLVLALVLVFLTAAIAFALTGGFGILDYNASMKDNKDYAAHILGIHESYENEYIDMTVNEAVFDGVSLSLTMNINHHADTDPVYILPRLTAETTDGQALEVDIEGARGGNWHSGFFVPSRDSSSVSDGCYGVDAVLLTDGPDGETTMVDSQESAVTWRLRFYIFHPEYPIVSSAMPNDPGLSDEAYLEAEQAWMESFAEAYRQQLIQTDEFGEILEYVLSLPHDGMDDETWFMLPLEEQLLYGGAFTLVDTVEISFSTGENDLHQIAAEQVFDLGDGWQARLTNASVTFARCDLLFTVSRTAADGRTAADYAQENSGWSFAVLADGQPGTLSAGSVSREYQDGRPTGNLLYNFTMQLNGFPETLCLLPAYSEHGNQSVGWLSDVPQLTPEEEAQLLFIELP